MPPAANSNQVQFASEEDLLNALSGRLPARRPSIFYMAGLFIVSLVMVALPLIYLGLIGAVGWGVYYHATNDYGIVTASLPARQMRVRVVFYVLPIVAGAGLILFMLKPLIARSSIHESGVEIDENNEPLLMAYLERLCSLVGAPPPRKVRIYCMVNAAASLGAGLRGLFGRKVDLHIGLPLLAGMNVQEVTCVLAHELGHFRQRLAMRLCYVIGSINGWFARVVYQRDSWDEQLLAASKSGQVGIIFLVLRFMVWLTRRILWLLMYIARALSCFLSRQMEFNADRCASQVVGVAGFRSTQQKAQQLNLASEFGMQRIATAWAERRLPDNLPVLIAAETRNVSETAIEKSRDAQLGMFGRVFSTHPTDSARVRAVEKAGEPGILHLTAPGRSLFRNFDAACKASTLVHYRERISPQISASSLIATQTLVQESTKTDDEIAAIDSYLGHKIYAARPIFIDPEHIGICEDSAKTIQTLRSAYGAIANVLPQVKAAYDLCVDIDKKLTCIEQVDIMRRCEIRIKSGDCGLSDFSDEAIKQRRQELLTQKKQPLELIAKYERALQLRLTCALQLLQLPAIVKAMRDGEQGKNEARKMTATLDHLREAFARHNDIRSAGAALTGAFISLRRQPNNELAMNIINSQIRDMLYFVGESRAHLAEIPYPFEHGRGGASIAEYLLEYVPGELDIQTALSAIVRFGDNLDVLYIRVLGCLIYISARVERVVGITESDKPHGSKPGLLKKPGLAADAKPD